jgi:hypothetical protein
MIAVRHPTISRPPAAEPWTGRVAILLRIGGVWAGANHSPYAPIQSIDQFGRGVPWQRVQVLDIEVELADFIGATRRNNCQPEPKCETRLEVDTVPLARVIGHDETGAPNLGHYFVADTADVILVINTYRPKSSRAYARIKTVCPYISQASIKPHGNKTLGRIGAYLQRFSGQQSLWCNSARSPIITEQIIVDQNPYQEIETLFIDRIRNALQLWIAPNVGPAEQRVRPVSRKFGEQPG